MVDAVREGRRSSSAEPAEIDVYRLSGSLRELVRKVWRIVDSVVSGRGSPHAAGVSQDVSSFWLEWGPTWARGCPAIPAVNLDSAVAALSTGGPRFSQGCGLTTFLTKSSG